jgi:hypothetical protein
MIQLLIWLIVLCVVVGIAYWIISQIPLPAPMNMVVRVLFGIIVLVCVLYFAGSVIGPPHLGGRLN